MNSSNNSSSGSLKALGNNNNNNNNNSGSLKALGLFLAVCAFGGFAFLLPAPPVDAEARRVRQSFLRPAAAATAASTTPPIPLYEEEEEEHDDGGDGNAAAPSTSTTIYTDSEWAPQEGDITELTTADHGAWIMPQKAFPRMRPGTPPEEFNDRLVGAITRELAKAWPPRVVPTMAKSLLDFLFGGSVPVSQIIPRDDEQEDDEPPAKLAKRRRPKVAFLFLVAGAVPTEPIWEAFFSSSYAQSRSSVYVHPPRGFGFERGSFLATYAIPQRARQTVTWGSLSMVHAELVLIATALRDKNNSHFVLLSETDVPLWPFECTYSALISTPEHSFVQSRQTEERWDMFDFDVGNASKRHTDHPPRLSTWRKGSQWFTLTRKHAELIAKKAHIGEWYDAQARTQLSRRKVGNFGPFSKLNHIMKKPSFADEHYVQTTLATHAADRKKFSGSLVPVSLTFAAFGKPKEYTVWGNGITSEFRLDAAEWHALQFGALSFNLLERLHELCDFDLATGDRQRRGPYEPKRLRCSFAPGKPGTGSPCYLFMRKLHSEAVNYYSQLISTFFMEKANQSLRVPFDRARRAQLEGARTETMALLTGNGLEDIVGDYAERDLKTLNGIVSVLPEQEQQQERRRR